MEDFPTDLRNMHQFRNFSCFPTTRAEPLTLRLLRLAMNVFSTIIYFPLIYFSSCPNYCLFYPCFSMSAVICLCCKLQVRVETWICLLAVDLKDLWLNHGAASSPACSVGGWLYFLSCPLCCLQDILKGYQLIWLKHGRQIAFGYDSDPDLRMLFPCSNKHHQP